MSETIPHSPVGPHSGAPGSASPSALRSNARLLTLNGVLLLILAGVTLSSSRLASAQPDARRDSPRLRGEYTMVSGRTQGLTTSTLYIIDAVNQEIVALNWDRNANKPEVIGLRSLAEDSRFLERVR